MTYMHNFKGLYIGSFNDMLGRTNILNFKYYSTVIQYIRYEISWVFCSYSGFNDVPTSVSIIVSCCERTRLYRKMVSCEHESLIC